MSLPWFFGGPSWTVLAGSVVATAALAFPYGAYVGWSHERDKATNALLKATQQARQTEQNWATNVAALEEVHADEIRDIATQRDAALLGLRDRPSGRMPPTAPASGNGLGATGAQLSGPDAEAFTRLAADADERAADLRACQAWVEAVTLSGRK